MDNSFPFQTPIEVIFRDVDAMGHVNNAVYFTYLETARTRFFFQGLSIGSLGELRLPLGGAVCREAGCWAGCQQDRLQEL
jgi:acyl-CoA thioester hydrolase